MVEHRGFYWDLMGDNLIYVMGYIYIWDIMKYLGVLKKMNNIECWSCYEYWNPGTFEAHVNTVGNFMVY